MREKAICTTNCFDSVLFFLRSFRSCILCCVGSNIEANSYWNIGSIVMMMVYYVLCGAESLWGALEKHTLIRHMLHSFVSLLALRQHLRGCAQNESAFVTQFLIPGITSHLASFYFYSGLFLFCAMTSNANSRASCMRNTINARARDRKRLPLTRSAFNRPCWCLLFIHVITFV